MSKETENRLSAALSNLVDLSSASAMLDSRPEIPVSPLKDIKFAPRTLEDDPAFSRLLDALDEYAKASERSARRSFVCAVVSVCVALVSSVAAVLALLL